MGAHATSAPRPGVHGRALGAVLDGPRRPAAGDSCAGSVTGADAGPGQLDQDDEGLVHGRQGADPQPQGGGPVERARGRPTPTPPPKAAADHGLHRHGLPLLSQAQPRLLLDSDRQVRAVAREPRAIGQAATQRTAMTIFRGQATRPQARIGRRSVRVWPRRGTRRTVAVRLAFARRASTSVAQRLRFRTRERLTEIRAARSTVPGLTSTPPRAACTRTLTLRVEDAVEVVGAQLDRGGAEGRPRELGAVRVDLKTLIGRVLRGCRRRRGRRSRWGGPLPRCGVLRAARDGQRRGRRPQGPAVERARELHEVVGAGEVARPGSDHARAGAGDRPRPAAVVGSDGDRRRPRRTGPAADEDGDLPGALFSMRTTRTQRSRASSGCRPHRCPAAPATRRGRSRPPRRAGEPRSSGPPASLRCRCRRPGR